MNGQQLYQMYADSLMEAFNCSIGDTWAQLNQDDRNTWDILASKVVQYVEGAQE